MEILSNFLRRENAFIDYQSTTLPESVSDFIDVLSKISRLSPKTFDKSAKILKASLFNAELGPMIAIGGDSGLYLLEFMDSCGLQSKILRLMLNLKIPIVLGSNDSIRSIEDEIKAYFGGKLRKFTTKIHFLGSPFQKLVWKKLYDIPYGQTWTYVRQAVAIGKPKAYRAVANANGANHFAIVIPCHRIVKSNGDLGGYAGGVRRKQCLIDHEKNMGNRYI